MMERVSYIYLHIFLIFIQLGIITISLQSHNRKIEMYHNTLYNIEFILSHVSNKLTVMHFTLDDIKRRSDGRDRTAK